MAHAIHHQIEPILAKWHPLWGAIGLQRADGLQYLKASTKRKFQLAEMSLREVGQDPVNLVLART
jgi:hypothetical protein